MYCTQQAALLCSVPRPKLGPNNPCAICSYPEVCPPALPSSAQGKLYLYESAAPGAKLAATEAVWAAERRVVRVPPEQIGGADHVVALCPGK